MEYLTVYDLNREQLNELKAAYFDDPDFEEINEGTYKTPEEIPDEIIFEHWDGVRMDPDDFGDPPEPEPSPCVPVKARGGDFQGFHSVAEYERECVRLGYPNRREKFHRGNEKYTVLIGGVPHPSPSSVESWHLLNADETAELLNGVINGSLIGGVEINYHGTLAAHGYFPDDPAEEQRLLEWLASPDFKSWIELPASRPWLATWCIPYALREEMKRQGYVWPTFTRDGFDESKPHSFGGWKYYSEGGQPPKAVEQTEPPERTEPKKPKFDLEIGTAVILPDGNKAGRKALIAGHGIYDNQYWCEVADADGININLAAADYFSLENPSVLPGDVSRELASSLYAECSRYGAEIVNDRCKNILHLLEWEQLEL